MFFARRSIHLRHHCITVTCSLINHSCVSFWRLSPHMLWIWAGRKLNWMNAPSCYWRLEQGHAMRCKGAWYSDEVDDVSYDFMMVQNDLWIPDTTDDVVAMNDDKEIIAWMNTDILMALVWCCLLSATSPLWNRVRFRCPCHRDSRNKPHLIFFVPCMGGMQGWEQTETQSTVLITQLF